jgi:hypothetical protein
MNSSHQGENFDRGGPFRGHQGVAKVEYTPAHQRRRISTAKHRMGPATARAAPEGKLLAMLRRWGTIPRCATAASSKHDANPDEHQYKRPNEFPWIERHESKRIQQQPATYDDQRQSTKPAIPATATEHRKSDQNHHCRPESPDIVDRHDPEFGKRQSDAHDHQEDADDKPRRAEPARFRLQGDSPASGTESG